jgi:hypothetical protein
MSADRKDTGKLPIHLVPPSAILAMAEVLEMGAKKYAERNWEKGMSYSRCYNSAMRHLLAWHDGQDLDPESNLNHLKHVLTNIAFLIEYLNTHTELDDRPEKFLGEEL